MTLDVGSGTGMFAAALAETDDVGLTIGIDPSRPMLIEAQRLHDHRRVRYVVGDAVALPIAAHRVDLALLSRVIHHLNYPGRCARELYRVMRPGGVLVVRTTVRERLDALVYDYWPRLRELDQTRFPSTAMIIEHFESAGFLTTTIESFAQPVQPGLRAYHDAVAARPQSKFNALTAAEFTAGLACLNQDADAEKDPHPIEERYDVLVFTAR